MYQKLKSLLADDLVFTTILVVLVAFISFFLGRASVNEQITPIRASQPAAVGLTRIPPVSAGENANSSKLQPAETPSRPAVATGTYVASKSGTKYHLVTCGSANAIKEENRIYFSTENEAVAAGYTRAANCSGW